MPSRCFETASRRSSTGDYREHDILMVTDDGTEHNIVDGYGGSVASGGPYGHHPAAIAAFRA